MMKVHKVLIGFLLITFSLFSQTLPVLAAYDGFLARVSVDGLAMRTGPGTGYSTVMTMSNAEAVAYPGEEPKDLEGYHWMKFKGWKSTTNSIVSGWAAQYNLNTGTQYIYSTVLAISKDYLTLYSADSPSNEQQYNTGLSNDIPPGVYLYTGNGNIHELYSDLYYFKISRYYNGSFHDVYGGSGYVHTNFRSSSPYNYYISLN